MFPRRAFEGGESNHHARFIFLGNALNSRYGNFLQLMNNFVSAVCGCQAFASLFDKAPELALSSTSLSTLNAHFPLFRHTAEIPLFPFLPFHRDNTCHLGLCAGEHNLVV